MDTWQKQNETNVDSLFLKKVFNHFISRKYSRFIFILQHTQRMAPDVAYSGQDIFSRSHLLLGLASSE